MAEPAEPMLRVDTSEWTPLDFQANVEELQRMLNVVEDEGFERYFNGPLRWALDLAEREMRERVNPS